MIQSPWIDCEFSDTYFRLYEQFENDGVCDEVYEGKDILWVDNIGNSYDMFFVSIAQLNNKYFPN
jgi:hypothetical protein